MDLPLKAKYRTQQLCAKRASCSKYSLSSCCVNERAKSLSMNDHAFVNILKTDTKWYWNKRTLFLDEFVRQTEYQANWIQQKNIYIFSQNIEEYAREYAIARQKQMWTGKSNESNLENSVEIVHQMHLTWTQHSLILIA